MISDNKVIKAIGLMSGTSLDGLDVVACEFKQSEEKWHYTIIDAFTQPYSKEFKLKLQNSNNIPAIELQLLSNEFGKLMGQTVSNFMHKINFDPAFIASHGHTVFHQPNKGLTVQIGSGAEIAAQTGIRTICDFRTSDVALGGQGAPLVPIGDKLLFSEYDACLNLGGFANISYNSDKGVRNAFDICPVNIVLNYFANKLDLSFDKDGGIGRKGKVDKLLLNRLNDIVFYTKQGPKSLAWEFVEGELLPLISADIENETVFSTLYKHIAQQIAKVVNSISASKMLVTGGGVYNSYLIELIKKECNSEIIIPDSNIIEYKEALIFAFLGLLRLKEQPNCLSQVTGARKDSIGGSIYI